MRTRLLAVVVNALAYPWVRLIDAWDRADTRLASRHTDPTMED